MLEINDGRSSLLCKIAMSEQMIVDSVPTTQRVI